MSKNKLMWNIALFLIVIASLPIAYAQTFAGSRIYFVVINAAIIGVLLFILQAVLVPGKAEKERTSIWIIIVIASLLLAWFYGSNGYIWQGHLERFFSVYVLVNSIIIAAFLYFPSFVSL